MRQQCLLMSLFLSEDKQSWGTLRKSAPSPKKIFTGGTQKSPPQKNLVCEIIINMWIIINMDEIMKSEILRGVYLNFPKRISGFSKAP